MEMNTQNLTILKSYLLKTGFEHLHIAEITAGKRAVFEAEATQIQA